ncbi:MAG TPA: efflux RND transporter periplasmic adaptor subunit [Gammaproteobacteria bacterium]
MKQLNNAILIYSAVVGLSACGPGVDQPVTDAIEAEAEERGPNNGRMLRDDGFAVELAIFEAGVPPEFRAWVTRDGQPVNAAAVDLRVTLTRLGGVDEIGFEPQGNYLRGDLVVYEPHSFLVTVDAGYQARDHRWEYESFEGRTRIAPEMAEAFGIETMAAGSATLRQVTTVYGNIVPNPERVRELSARFDGAIQSVDAALGQTVRQGQRLATIESNESLQTYAITAPIAGTIMERAANGGEQTNGRRLFTIVDTSSVWAELAIFPAVRASVQVGAPVEVTPATGGEGLPGVISYLNPVASANQSITARVELDNGDGRWALGSFVTGAIVVEEFQVPLAVRRSGLQSFREFTVVYARFGDQSEVRMLELGRQDENWVEVLGGLEPGTRYVTENSYVIKADVEKSGATHDH